MEFRIRPADVEDSSAIYQIWRDGSAISLGAELPTTVDYEPQFREKIGQQDDTFKFFVAEGEDGVIGGWISLTPFRSNPAVRQVMAELSAYVRTDMLRSGIITRLIEHTWKHAERTPLQYINAFISSANQTALVAAINVGFLIIGTLPASPKSNAPPLTYITKVVASAG